MHGARLRSCAPGSGLTPIRRVAWHSVARAPTNNEPARAACYGLGGRLALAAQRVVGNDRVLMRRCSWPRLMLNVFAEPIERIERLAQPLRRQLYT